MSESATKARCTVCSWPLFVHEQGRPCAEQALAHQVTNAQETMARLPIRGVRVDGENVVVSVSGGNEAARMVCGALLAMRFATPAPTRRPAPATTCSYPKCECPFDAPSDPNWCARGYPKKLRDPAQGAAG